MERRQRARQIQLAVIGQNDIIGDLEMALDLPSFSSSVECLESLECYELDKPNFHRLIVKRNPETLELIRDVAIAKLRYRSKRLEHIPYYQLLLEKADQDFKTPVKPIKARPKSVGRALAGLIEGKKTVKKGDFLKRMSTGSDSVPAAPAANADDGKQRFAFLVFFNALRNNRTSAID
jgi:CRP-like cAMP-binding protein